MTRQKSIEQPPAGRGVRIVLHGKDYEGTYTLDGPIVVVEAVMLGTKRAPLAGDVTPVALARLLLAELADEHERRSQDAASPAANESTFRIVECGPEAAVQPDPEFGALPRSNARNKQG